MVDDNPFERYDLDPREGIGAITQRLKELAEDAKDDAEREKIREAWEELTLHPARRLRAALFAHPETRGPIGNPPSFPRRKAASSVPELGLRDLAARPSILQMLGRLSSSSPPEGTAGTAGPAAAAIAALEDDPVLRGLK